MNALNVAGRQAATLRCVHQIIRYANTTGALTGGKNHRRDRASILKADVALISADCDPALELSGSGDARRLAVSRIDDLDKETIRCVFQQLSVSYPLWP